MSEETPQPEETEEETEAKAASTLGRRGGWSGSGESKRRDPEHYTKTLVEARRKAAFKRKLKSL